MQSNHQEICGKQLSSNIEKTSYQIMIIAISGFVVYANCITNQFVLDDHQMIERHPIVQGEKIWIEAFSEPYHGEKESLYKVYRPIPVLTFFIQSQFSLEPWFFHVANILLNVFVSILVFYLWRDQVGNKLALIGSVLFAIHPIHTDAVTPAYGRAELLSAVFTLLSLLTWRLYLSKERHIFLFATLLFFLFALLSKESSVPTLLFAIYLAWGYEKQRLTIRGWAIAYLSPFLFYLFMRKLALGGVFESGGLEYFSAYDQTTTVLTLLSIFGRYVCLLLFPYPLSPDYSYLSIPPATTIVEPYAIVGLFFALLSMALIFVCLIKKVRVIIRILPGVVFFWVFMLPASHIIPLMIPMAERLIYIPSVGWCMCLVVLFQIINRYIRKVGYTFLGLYLVVLAGLTIDRNNVWETDLSLWSDVISHYPNNALALANLGGELAMRGDVRKGVSAINKALEIAPGKWEFREALAEILHDYGLHEEETKVLLDGFRYEKQGKDPDYNRICKALRETGQEGKHQFCNM